ncbi:hypothetical protein [Bordetella sp. 2513F-2]
MSRAGCCSVRWGAAACVGRQGGQALVEALAMVLALLALVHAMSWTGRLQSQSLAAGQASRAMAFAAAQGYGVPGMHDGMSMQSTRDVRAGTRSGGAGAGALDALARDWLAVDTRLLRIEAGRMVTPAAGLERGLGTAAPISLRRHTTLAAGDGRAASELQAQQRLLRSHEGWGRAGNVSRSLGQSLRSRVGAMETAWGNRAPEDDWVRRWADLVPSDRLGGRRP